MKKFFSLLLTVIILTSLASCGGTNEPANGTAEVEADGVTWSLDGTNKTFSVYGNGELGDCELGEDGTVDSGFYYMRNLVCTLDVCEGVTRLGAYNFYGFDQISEIYFPQSLTEIAEHTFEGCEGLSVIHYAGTTAEWSEITIGASNEPLAAASVICEG